ncbi:protein translocase subunit SecF [Microlunatus sp. Gsoil 973]|uniref:protein translocase subunit SecF n=1 Tax=Microlunatus sp. Gsoil 973 TaxID=2672569 RepID=UPI0012B46A17|nr:protein translocase subunit SecF [Microlunatus sp. Gsoil 973]QGN32701.1 protein translocase subunit SecF [Microlunatus sp. Gsoil 973]
MSRLGNLGHGLYTGEVSFDFVGRWRRWFIISAVAILIVVAGFALRGLNLGIEFTGGAEFQIPASTDQATIQKVEDALANSGVPHAGDAEVTRVGNSTIRVETSTLNTASEVPQVKDALAEATGAPVDQINYNLIGASWGGQITERGIVALVVFLVVVSLVLWAYMRNAKMSGAALVALLHDLVITLGVYAVVGFSFTPESLIGMLTILGYSLYDTVVVFDKVRENTRNLTGSATRTYSEAANLAVNQTLVRSINTTVIGVLPVAALLFAGGVILHTGPLEDLALALFVGMISGAYSSIFIATPLLALWKEREPDMIRQTKRVATRRARDAARERGEEPPSRSRRRTATPSRRTATSTAGTGSATLTAEGTDDRGDETAADGEDDSGSSAQDRLTDQDAPGDRAPSPGRITLAVRDHGTGGRGETDARRDRLSDRAAGRPQPQRKPRSERKK